MILFFVLKCCTYTSNDFSSLLFYDLFDGLPVGEPYDVYASCRSCDKPAAKVVVCGISHIQFVCNWIFYLHRVTIYCVLAIGTIIEESEIVKHSPIVLDKYIFL